MIVKLQWTNQNLASESELLLVTRQNDNHSPGPWLGRLVPSSRQRSELSNTILGTFRRVDKRVWKCIPVPNGLREKATLINISVNNGNLICLEWSFLQRLTRGIRSLLVFWLSDLCITIWVYCLSSVSWGIPILNVQECQSCSQFQSYSFLLQT